MIWHLKKIPLMAHCYFGGRIPWLRYISILSFIKHNHNIPLRLYVPSNLHDGNGYRLTHGEIAAREYTGHDYIDELSCVPGVTIVQVEFDKIGFTDTITETFKADYLRMLLMSTVGGIWIDSDILFWKSIEQSYFNKPECSETCNVLHITLGDSVYHSTGIVMASPEKSIFKRCMELINVSYHQLDSQSIASNLLNRVSISIADISQKYGIAINLCDDYVYPIGAGKFNDIFINTIEPGTWQTIGLHWYGGAELARECVHGMAHNTWRKYNNTLAKAIERSGVV